MILGGKKVGFKLALSMYIFTLLTTLYSKLDLIFLNSQMGEFSELFNT